MIMAVVGIKTGVLITGILVRMKEADGSVEESVLEDEEELEHEVPPPKMH
jgi:hypothetical protein